MFCWGRWERGDSSPRHQSTSIEYTFILCYKNCKKMFHFLSKNVILDKKIYWQFDLNSLQKTIPNKNTIA